jgi:hypothetical protein
MCGAWEHIFGAPIDLDKEELHGYELTRREVFMQYHEVPIGR